jgi:hypothetical protein
MTARVCPKAVDSGQLLPTRRHAPPKALPARDGTRDQQK